MGRCISSKQMSTFCHTQAGPTIADVSSGRTSSSHFRHSSNEYFMDIIQCAATSENVLAHYHAAETSQLSDVVMRSQGKDISSGHARSVD